jgi:DNA-directed RNA polymerase specialized sigma24 family protein
MSILVRGPTPHPIVESSSANTSPPGADDGARRLATALARGDEAAFRQLYDRYQPRLFRLALVLGRGDELLAQDTVQSVFVTAAAKLRRVDSEEHLWNWLARVARQQLARTRR